MSEPRSFHNGRVMLHAGDCLAVLDSLHENSIDAIVSDPPYHLTSIVKRFGGDNSAPAQHGTDGLYARASRGFMGKEWDGGDIAFRAETWAKVMRVLKPGGHLVAFSAPKCFHRMVCAIEDAGFEIRDSLQWMFGTGFPKSHNLKDEWVGWGTALKPAYEPICLARKPLSEPTVAANVLRWGTGAINIDGCRIEGSWERKSTTRCDIRGGRTVGGGSGALECEPQSAHALGRWPANICHDRSEDVVAAFPDTASGGAPTAGNRTKDVYGEFAERSLTNHGVNSGSAARFFYSAKANSTDRAFSKHPTVKPVDLMRWLVRMVTPPGGTVLDPFSGTGTTGHAALLEGFNAILIEREPEYLADIERRMALVFAGDIERAAHTKQDSHDALPLFGGADIAGGGKRLVYGKFARDGQSGRSD